MSNPDLKVGARCRSSRSPRGFVVGLPLLAVASLQCADLVAPDGAEITLTANPTLIAAEGDVATIDAVVVDGNGQPVDDETRVVFTSTLGVLCDGSRCSTAISVESEHGIAKVVFLSGSVPGEATISARSGKAVKEVKVNVSALVAPEDCVAALTAQPDTIVVGTGSASILAFFTTSVGDPVRDGTRVAFSAAAGSLAPRVTLTQAGYAVTTLAMVAEPVTVQVHIVSGTLRDSVAVAVRP